VGHLILPDEVQILPEVEGAAVAPREGRLPDFDIEPAPDALKAATEALREAKRPVIILGYGAKRAAADVVRLAEHLDAPMVTTFKAKGLVSDDHPLACGVLGRSGTPVGSWFMNECDLLLVLGASFSKHTGITDKKGTIQVDVDPMQLGKFHPVDIPLWAEIGRAVGRFTKAVPSSGDRGSAGEVAARWKIWRKEKAKRARDDRGLGLPAAFIFKALSERAPADAVIAVDVGNNTYSFGRYFEAKGQSVLMSGYMGAIGFGLPAGIGAACGAPGRKVLVVCGDGGFGQYLADFTTAVKYELDVTVVLLNNGQLGKISKEQRAGEYAVWQTSLVNPGFAEFAKLCGAMGVRVEDRASLGPVLQQAIAHEGTALVEIMQDGQLI
jgi:thiamine pyrophosphate-dependent acetolactate synthase large subunit-like protein